MGLEQKLLQLDEVIWKQYEKVTQAADKYLGLDKYDLAKGCNNLVVGGALASSLYYGLYSIKEQSGPFGVVSLTYLGMAGLNYFAFPKVSQSLKKREQREVQQGIILAPVFNSIRPSGLIISMCAYGVGTVFFNNHTTDSSLLLALSNLSIGFYLSGAMSRWYFHDQIPKPPRKNPAKLQEWYNSLRASLGRKVMVGAKCEGIEERLV